MIASSVARSARPFDGDHDAFRESVRRFTAAEVAPVLEAWRSHHGAPATLFSELGKHGFLGTMVPEEYGGGGVDDIRFVVALVEEFAGVGATGLARCLALHAGVALPLLARVASAPDHRRTLEKAVSGASVLPVAAARAAEESPLRVQLVAGASYADAAVAVTDDAVLLVPSDLCTSEVSRPLGGLDSPHGDLSVDSADVSRLPRLRDAGGTALVTRDLRFWHAVVATEAAHRALRLTVDYVGARKVFGTALSSFENTRNRLAEVAARLALVRLYVDSCIAAHAEGTLDAESASVAMMEAGAAHDLAVDQGLQLHGGYGYMREYPISAAFADAHYLRGQEQVFGNARRAVAEAALGFEA
ncbi:hypothetical protein A5742_14665 [Mycolicibacterium fortuitum]|uniref:Acyl-CoA dehydrogenase n=1 Tax=Mycolicibacterium fortuitum TaxID=1766 RepID=A0ABD6QC75_MYCFO|nr:acyl-CoA dehydrogenase family protein [Mycolicibacterium fortuitum]OMC33133.1 hypothetical protein A5742_14665 [Mycolicibacterium fortuitum]